MRAWLVVTWLCAGCGRWGFTVDSTTDGGASGDGKAAIDAAGVSTASFGERTGATHANVTADTTLRQAQPSSNYGGDDNLSLSATSTGLLRFDTSALPPGTQVVSAALDLSTEDVGLTSGSVEVYVVNEAWTEGTAMGTAGVASYTMRTATLAWTNQGAGPPTSRGATAVASFVPAAINTDYVVPLDAAAVQAWVDTPTANFGVALVVNGTGTTSLQSHETTSATRRPLLVVSYR